jgi:4-azaleucine resistance transporter AzlC
MSLSSPIQADSKLKLIIKAILDVMPLSIAVIPWGILTGAISIQIGMTPLQGQFMSLLVFAGAAQLSSMTLMSSMASNLTIFGTTFVISSRHLLYSITFRQHVLKLPLSWRLAIAFVLTDEMFAVSQVHTQRTGHFSVLYALVVGFAFYAIWNIATLIGIVAGDYFDNIDSLGLDFAIVATFIAMTFDRLREWPVAVAIVVGGTMSILVKPYFTDSYIIVAGLIGMFAAYAVSSKTKNEVERESKEVKG